MGAFYKSTVAQFLSIEPSKLFFDLTSGTAALGFDLKANQHNAWPRQISILKKALCEMVGVDASVSSWGLLLEYQIPGRAKRLDTVLLDGHGIIAIEFKVGAVKFGSGDRWQLRQYCWDLRDFHCESQNVPIAQILVATDADKPHVISGQQYEDKQHILLPQSEANERTFQETLVTAHEKLKQLGKHKIDLARWDSSQAHTTGSIIAEAQRLFAANNVREVQHAHSDDTAIAEQTVIDIVRKSRAEHLRSVCFITGVPGAGKTLVGLHAAYSAEMVEAAGQPACFASGNRPLLDVLLAALTLDHSADDGSYREIGHGFSAPMQNVHDFAERNLLDAQQRAPTQCVVVFDEAQRVWTEEKVEKGLEKKVGRKRLTREQADEILEMPHSEPDLLLRVMERCEDWCVVIALVGGGQEIYEGEAGLGAWGLALEKTAKKWTVWVTPQAVQGDASVAGKTLFPHGTPNGLSVKQEKKLHLSVTKRSGRAEKYAEWVNCVLSGKRAEAARLASDLEEFPLILSRNLTEAKRIVREYAGDEGRYGIIASSGAMRLRADGLELRREFRDALKYPDWFLRPFGDIRSSTQLEVAATEFECQGLELDWTLVCWGGDLALDARTTTLVPRSLYTYKKRGPDWRIETDAAEKEFIQNKYRVILTRARFGSVIFVPSGDEGDFTRQPNELNILAEYLRSCGVDGASSIS